MRGYETLTGKKLWEFDTNPKDSVWPKTRNESIGTPVIYEDRSTSPTARIPSTARASATSTRSTPPSAATSRRPAASGTTTRSAARSRRASIADGLLYIPDFSGFLHCLDAKTGQEYWTHDIFAAVWGSTLVVDGKVYLGDEDGDIVVLQAGKEKKVLAEMNMGSAVYATPVPGPRRALPQQPQPAVRAVASMGSDGDG